jgi:hypothetical protein
MVCPLHRINHDDGAVCPMCQRQNMRVVTCELDKMERVTSTMQQEGFELDHQQSFVRLVSID